MRLPRFHLRTLLLIVALAAVLMAVGAELGRRQSAYLRRTAYHAYEGRYGGEVFGGGVVLRSEPKRRKPVITSLAKIEHHARLAEKYQYAARTRGSRSQPIRPSRDDRNHWQTHECWYLDSGHPGLALFVNL